MALPRQSKDFPAWYQAVVKAAEMAENGVVRGTMVIRPYGYAIWEGMQSSLDARIKETGHQNLYFPMLIPYRLLEKEKDHVEGFSPQVAVVTHAGGEELSEPLVIRPTSETIIWETYSRWIQSYRDLPLLYNQWANVVRWEMRPRLFLRTTEFLWQEGHTAHETGEEAWSEARRILLDVYRAAVEDDFAIPVLTGRKSASERFPGALETLTIEALMRDGKALQAGTSHYFGENLARAYGVKFQGRDGNEQLAHATSWGASTRLVGGLVMTHGDDKGLRLPPRLAPYQVVIIPIYASDAERSRVLEACEVIKGRLDGVRVHVDSREKLRPGFKFNEWELKGAPTRLEIGPRDLDKGSAILYRRDTGEKRDVPIEGLTSELPHALDAIQKALFDEATQFRDSHTFDPASYEEFRELATAGSGFIRSLWCGDPACEQRVKDETKATSRLLPLDAVEVEGGCLICGRKATEPVTWAQSY